MFTFKFPCDKQHSAGFRGGDLYQEATIQRHVEDGGGFDEVRQAGPRHPPDLAHTPDVNDVEVVVGDGETFTETCIEIQGAGTSTVSL